MAKKRITDVGFSEILTEDDSLFINQNDSIKQIGFDYLKQMNFEDVKEKLIVKLTQAEYDALPDSKNSDGILYAIIDD